MPAPTPRPPISPMVMSGSTLVVEGVCVQCEFRIGRCTGCMPARSPHGARLWARFGYARRMGHANRPGLEPDAIIQQLGLEPHPERGYYRETYRAPASVQVDRPGRVRA